MYGYSETVDQYWFNLYEFQKQLVNCICGYRLGNLIFLTVINECFCVVLHDVKLSSQYDAGFVCQHKALLYFLHELGIPDPFNVEINNMYA